MTPRPRRRGILPVRPRPAVPIVDAWIGVTQRSVGLGRVVANDDRLQDREDLVARHTDAPGMLADRFRVRAC
jgi:hypothetical protein